MKKVLKRLLKAVGVRRKPSPIEIPVGVLEKQLVRASEAQVRRRYKDDPWLQNYVLNVWEKVHGRTELTTYPWHQALSLADLCNAKCEFCTYSLATSGLLHLDALPKVLKIAPYARTFIITGGEATIHPQFREIISELGKAVDPRCFLNIISNGDRIGRFKEEFAGMNIGFCVSINAGTAGTHEEVMKMGAASFQRVIDNIRWLKSINKYVSLSFVVTQQNIHEVPEFIDLCHDLQADKIYVRTMNHVQGIETILPNYIDLAPYHHPQFTKHRAKAIEAIGKSKIAIQSTPEQWSTPLLVDWKGTFDLETGADGLKTSDAKGRTMTKGHALKAELLETDPGFLDIGNPYNRASPFSCNLVYYSTSILDKPMRMYPCCFMARVPGYEEMGFNSSDNFFELWNSPALIELRRSLKDGPLYPACKTCTYQLEY